MAIRPLPIGTGRLEHDLLQVIAIGDDDHEVEFVLLLRATKKLGRDHTEASRDCRAKRAVRGWAGEWPACCQVGAVQASAISLGYRSRATISHSFLSHPAQRLEAEGTHE
jgi:hypothetical protein